MCPGVMVSICVSQGQRLVLTFVEQNLKVNAPAWESMLEHHICPLLDPAKIVVMDNAPSHAAKHARAYYASVNMKYLCQSPNSPDLNVCDYFPHSVKETVPQSEENYRHCGHVPEHEHSNEPRANSVACQPTRFIF